MSSSFHYSSLADLSNSLKESSFGPNKCVQLLWPRRTCPLLEDNVVLIDSPGVDLDGDYDFWIENAFVRSRGRAAAVVHNKDGVGQFTAGGDVL